MAFVSSATILFTHTCRIDSPSLTRSESRSRINGVSDDDGFLVTCGLHKRAHCAIISLNYHYHKHLSKRKICSDAIYFGSNVVVDNPFTMPKIYSI